MQVFKLVQNKDKSPTFVLSASIYICISSSPIVRLYSKATRFLIRETQVFKSPQLSLARLLHEVCRFLQISSALHHDLQWQIPMRKYHGERLVTWRIIGLCAPRNSTAQRWSALKRLSCRSSLSLTQRASLSALLGPRRSQGLRPQLRGRWDSLSFGWNESKQHCLRAWPWAVIPSTPPQSNIF